MKLVPTLIAVSGVTAIALSGCSSSSSSSKSSAPAGGTSSAAASSTAPALSGSINVFAASSLTGTFNSLGTSFMAAHPGTKITFNFGSSGTLATQITQGAPADVFASAATKNMQTVLDAKEANTPTNFVKNTMEIAVPATNPARITSLADLAKPGVKVALCIDTAPCGVTAEQVFTNAKLTIKPVTQEADAKTTISKVTLGEADAAVVYVTDVKAATGVTGIEIPADVNATTEYPIATLTNSTDSALAAAFVAYVLSSTGHGVLAAAGFEAP
jgi:molybdate transport system substrate-binding protein